MGRVIAIGLILFSATAWAQKRVSMTSDDVRRFQLSPSLDNTYAVFTFSEYKKLRIDLSKLKVAADKLGIVEKQLSLTREQLKKTEEKAATLVTDLKSCEASRKRITKKWSTCDLENRLCNAGSWKPWVITAISIAVGIAGAIVGAYYGIKYKKK